MTTFVFENLHHEQGWLSPARVSIDEHGMIISVEAGNTKPGENIIRGLAIPGMANLHSHAFQRAMLGLTEFRASKSQDSFWTWRERMYQLALSISPDDLEAVAAQLYVEMLEAGITAVGEFHYLHHDVNGRAYSNPIEMSDRIFSAAHSSGITLTHLPVLYLNGGFGQEAGPKQARFIHKDVEHYLTLYTSLRKRLKGCPNNRLGVAPHSLRAVDSRSLSELVSVLGSDVPIHIHIAEQIKEVEEATGFLGAPPVRWLLDNHHVNHRWCLVHATHLNDEEVELFAASGAVAGLCPTTEANLGDGIFAANKYLGAGGIIGIGTDSHVNVCVATELRLLEYGQRLRDWKRNVLASEQEVSVGRRLLDASLSGGAQALNQPMGRIVPGQRADIVVLDPDHPRLLAHTPNSMLDAWVFGHAAAAVKQVMVSGQWEVLNGKHRKRSQIYDCYRRTVSRLWA